MTPDLELRLAARPESAARARQALAELGPLIGGEALEHVRLLVSELVTNSLRHADLSAADTVQVRVSVEGGAVRVEVLDPGPGFSPRRMPRVRERQGGWGLLLVERLADRWGVQNHTGGTLVWFELDIAGQRRN